MEELVVAGCDEAGRGPLAGPVYAAAVILPKGFEHPLVKDSKQLSERKRIEARDIVKETAIAWAVAKCDAQEIDEINILKASILAMKRAVAALYGAALMDMPALPVDRGGTLIVPELLLIDGNKFYGYEDCEGRTIQFKTIVKGDSLIPAISAASILAKTYRDDFMKKIAAEYPQYGWERNMAYPTAEHRAAILKYGITPYHRKTFLKQILSIL